MDPSTHHAVAEPSSSVSSPSSSPLSPAISSDPRTPPHPPHTTRRTSSAARAQQQSTERRSSRTSPLQRPQHPALLDAHTHRSNNLDLLESLDDETLAALANELREIGLGRAGAGSGGGVAGARGGTAQGGGQAQGGGGAAQRGSLGGTRPLRRATTTGTPAERERARLALSGSSSPSSSRSTLGPPPAYSPVDPLRRLATSGLRSAPLAVVHERRMSAPSGERWSG
ncbi:hypothetical protein JCM9279_006739 [Rhodotorula babjevae]